MIDDDSKRMIDDDLERLNLLYKMLVKSDVNDEELVKIEMYFPDEESIFSSFVGMNARYSSFIDNFPSDVDFKNVKDDEMEYQLVEYLRNATEKLRAFKRRGYKEMNKEGVPNIHIINENNNKNYNDNYNDNSNENHNKNKVSNTTAISFEDAKQEIENMSSLQDSEIQEILQKIDEIEKVVNSSDRKSKKWDSVKDIVKWVAEKSFDVAKTVIPLILNIN